MSVVERALGKMRRDSGRGAANFSPDSGRAIGALANDALPEHAASDVAPSRRILIDRDAVREAGYLPEASQDRLFADHYRQIKRPLIAAAKASPREGGSSARLIMMASALPGDGKTFTSINLALSMARERDISVVLVDADVAKPHVSRLFGVDSETGLLDSLSDRQIDIESLVLPTDVRGLSILPAGRLHDHATEMLASERMAELAQRLLDADPRRIVLFDSSPLLVTSESKALVRAVGQVVVVVRAVHTPRHAVLDAITHLGNGKSVHLILNEGHPSVTRGYYGQGGYGSHANDPPV